jgi:4,5-DOPA dioxygenase extradiol
MTGIFSPEVEAGAFDALLPERGEESRRQPGWMPADGPMPALYLSHGAPPLFNDAHWMTRGSRARRADHRDQ